ncbi:hypothetical protein SmJEL517_g04154 [Synchytrium microbalum]|uniref:Inositol polyphosphate-related phosphatase domain-containing protein n=1 Tax=Synchytrium microbalum TaxID=1806994 RepID=A0A507C073_9FUNG|nr:uncharacterized protein SmJEL517_g04154 [Synchytrium microbalum]TPX32801.1 hypothetical protein SmJEL517_g04154 [Synchytrium microbalum]
MKLLVGTWNVGASQPTQDIDLSSWIRPPAENNRETPDMIVLAFQEVTHPLTALAQSPVGKPGCPDSGPVHELVSAAAAAISSIYTEKEYTTVATHRLASMFITVFASVDVKDTILEIRTGDLGVGVAGIHGNKGAVAISLNIGIEAQRVFSLCLVGAHLSPHEGKSALARRVEEGSFIFDHLGLAPLSSHRRDIKPLGLSSRDGHIPLRDSDDMDRSNSEHFKSIYSHDAIIFCGDLNFRLIKSAPALDGGNSNNDGEANRASTSIDGALPSQDMNESVNVPKLIHDYDELELTRRGGILPFSMFGEATVTFDPTYKLKPIRKRNSKAKESPSILPSDPLLRPPHVAATSQMYSKSRRRAFPDRILYYAADEDPAVATNHGSAKTSSRVEDTGSPIKSLYYTAVKEITWSDHRPVAAMLVLDENLIAGRMNSTRSKQVTLWLQRKARLLRFVDKAGLPLVILLVMMLVIIKLTYSRH